MAASARTSGSESSLISKTGRMLLDKYLHITRRRPVIPEEAIALARLCGLEAKCEYNSRDDVIHVRFAKGKVYFATVVARNAGPTTWHHVVVAAHLSLSGGGTMPPVSLGEEEPPVRCLDDEATK